MIDTFDLYQSFMSYVNTYVGGWFRPQTDFIRACNDLSSKFWVKWTREAEKSQEAKDNLLSFLLSKNMLVKQSASYGSFKPPDKYGRFASARVIVSDKKICVPCKEVDDGKCANGNFKSDAELASDYYDTVEQWDVTLVDDQKWGAAHKHLTKKPTFEKPIMRQVDGGFQVSPRSVSVVVIDYYIQPKQATLVYSTTPGNVQTGAGDNFIYNKIQSEPLPWPENMRDEFLIGLGERYGLFTRDNFVSQIASQQKQTA